MLLPRAKKSLGQHWLTDTASLSAIVAEAEISNNDIVLEIGPGTGTLTDVLLGCGASLLALEYDEERARLLQKKYQSNKNVTVVSGDIRTFDLSTIVSQYKIVANIPYYLTANLLRLLIDTHHKPKKAVLLVQKEVAERICAKPGKLTLVAVLTQIFYEADRGTIVPPHLFVPPPNVDSQTLILTLRHKPLVRVNENFMKVVKAGFSQPRKKLRTSLSSSMGVSKQYIDGALRNVGLSEDVRAQELTIEQWMLLADTLNT